MLISIRRTACFDDTCPETGLAGHRLSWSIPEALRNACDALCEALAAHRQYERLRSSGVPHDTALREALGIGHPVRECRAADRGASASIGNLPYVK